MSPRLATALPDCLLLGAVLLTGLLHWFFPITTVATVWSQAASGTIAIVALIYGLGVLRRLPTTDAGIAPQQLTTVGIFAHSRNPYYLLCMVFLCGLAGVSGAISTVIAPVCYFLAIQWVVRYEENLLSKQFGEQYSQYRAKVRRWL